MRVKNLIIPIFLLPINIFAATSGAPLITIGPIYGFETVQAIEPKLHSQSRAYYGLRATVGNGFLQGEAEATQSKKSESFPDDDLKIDDTTNKAKLGLRFNFKMASFLDLFIRSGMQAKQSETTKTLNDTATTKKSAFYSDPYIGSGIRINLAKGISASGDYSIVFSDYPVSNTQEKQASFNISIGM